VKCVRDNGTLLLFANLGSNLFQVCCVSSFGDRQNFAMGFPGLG